MNEAQLLLIETLATGLLVLAGVYTRALSSRPFRWLESVFTRLASHATVAICIAAFLPLAVRLLLLPWLPIPNPVIIEEFGYWLQADTFSSGRLSNSPHPMAQHLEAFQQLMAPTYCSFRTPGQGLFMAAGQVVFRHPWAGVCLGTCVLGAAMCWMLQGWMDRRWALFGSLLLGFWYCVFGFWVNSYWGGAPAALGGCLMFGALPRIKSTSSPLAALLLCAGFAITESTRTYEGLFVAIPVFTSLGWWLLRTRDLLTRERVLRVALPITCYVALFAGWMMYYNWRTVGSPFKTAYSVGRARYNMAPPFLFQKPNLNIAYPHDVMRGFYVDWELTTFERTATVTGYIGMALYKVIQFWRLYIRPELTIALLAVLPLLRRRDMRLARAVFGLTILGLAIETWSPPYYYAPVTGVLVFALLRALQVTRAWRFDGRVLGSAVIRSTAWACATTIVLAVGLVVCRIPVNGQVHYRWFGLATEQDARAAVAQKFASMPGRHLLVVRYGSQHNVHYEWVWNRADIDGSKVVWARAMTDAKDRELLDYFRDRQAWLVEPDTKPIRITPLPADPSASATWRRAAGPVGAARD